ncbi:hypothetical protein [Nocardia farcinica]
MRRLHHAIRRLTAVLTPGSAVDQLAGQRLEQAEDAWERTQQMQTIYIALLQATAEAGSANGD